ncbi:Malonate--CoA ligase [Rhynchospora pubera]|uniref:4-coumarate--CoA ligase n=2 Tax=Rhynchospora pubera TaxID=906938 RepID=A0AAV8DAW4_9POAL|nr:Malonate--CoA ligase [Rhynchospora pubera]
MMSFKSPNLLLHLPSSPHIITTSSSSRSLRNGSLLFFSTSACRVFAAKTAVQPETSSMEMIKETIKHASGGQDRVALRAAKKSYSYLQLVSSALDISSILRTNVINGSTCLDGARVGIAAKPSPEFVAGVLGTWLCGGVAVPLALSYPEAELLHVMNDSDISMVLSSEEHQGVLENVAAQCSAKFSLFPSVASMSPVTESHEYSQNGRAGMISNLTSEVEKFPIKEGDDPALILYTSGTTGKPKGVVHTHNSILSQVQILTEAWEYSSKDQFLHCLPLHHVHGLFNALLAPLYAGAVVDFMPKFSVRGIWQRWRDSYSKDGYKADDAITLFTGVPTMYTRLLQGYEAMDADQRAASSYAAGQLRLMMCGSSALPYPVMKQWEDVTGHRLLERYGMTEFVMAISNPLHGNRKAKTVGKPLPRVEVKILSDEGVETKTGEGELCVRSPSLFKEYWKKETITKESFTDDGYFKTGDTVTLDEDGYFKILGRTNADIMKVGGYKLSALEIEAVLLEHDAVLECCVLGLADKDYGEVVCAIIVPHEDAKKKAEQESKPALTLQELRSWALERLAPYKLPKKLFLRDKLPRNAMGKVNKKEMKKLLEVEA